MIHLTTYGKGLILGTLTTLCAITAYQSAQLRATDWTPPKPAKAKTAPQKWHPCRITTYGKRPSGKPYHGGRTASGARYDDYGWTVAVPPIKKGSSRPMIPYGTYIDLRWKGTVLFKLKVTDLCPGGTFDVTRKAMVSMLGHYDNTTLRGAQWAKAVQP